MNLRYTRHYASLCDTNETTRDYALKNELLSYGLATGLVPKQTTTHETPQNGIKDCCAYRNTALPHRASLFAFCVFLRSHTCARVCLFALKFITKTR